MEREKLLSLQMFAEGAPAAEGNGGEADVGNETDAPMENTGAENTEAEANNPDEESFEALIGGKFKADFENVLNSRLAEKDSSISKLSAMLERQNSVFDALGAKYGLKGNDVDGILKAVSDDTTYFEEAAAREGLTVEQYKNLREFERMQEQQRAIQAEQMARTKAQNDLRDWYKQGEEVKKLYPEFDFQSEIKNKRFVDLLKNGIPVQTAFEVMHNDELITGAAKIAAKNAEKNAISKLQQKASRPVENGVASAPGAVINTASKLTRKERQALALRAQRGERVTL